MTVSHWRIHALSAMAAAVLVALAVYIAPGSAFVSFALDVVPAPQGLTVVVQTRTAPVSQPFGARWTAEILSIDDHGVMELACSGQGEHAYTWEDGATIAAWRAPVGQWVGDSDCVANLRPGETYFAEATWTFWALGRERSVTARSRTFIAQ